MGRRSRSVRSVLVLFAVAVMLLGACGGNDGDEESTSGAIGSDGDEASDEGGSSGDDGGATSGAVVDPAPPGQATVSVDGLDLSFEVPGALACSIGEESITFSYRIGDNEVTLGAGANRYDEGWLGGFDLSIANPDGEQGPIGYYPAPGENGILDGSLFAIDGASMSYSGPMLKQPANDGSNPPPVDVGTGTISATCG